MASCLIAAPLLHHADGFAELAQACAAPGASLSSGLVGLARAVWAASPRHVLAHVAGTVVPGGVRSQLLPGLPRLVWLLLHTCPMPLSAGSAGGGGPSSLTSLLDVLVRGLFAEPAVQGESSESHHAGVSKSSGAPASIAPVAAPPVAMSVCAAVSQGLQEWVQAVPHSRAALISSAVERWFVRFIAAAAEDPAAAFKAASAAELAACRSLPGAALELLRRPPVIALLRLLVEHTPEEAKAANLGHADGAAGCVAESSLRGSGPTRDASRSVGADAGARCCATLLARVEALTTTALANGGKRSREGEAKGDSRVAPSSASDGRHRPKPKRARGKSCGSGGDEEAADDSNDSDGDANDGTDDDDGDGNDACGSDEDDDDVVRPDDDDFRFADLDHAEEEEGAHDDAADAAFSFVLPSLLDYLVGPGEPSGASSASSSAGLDFTTASGGPGAATATRSLASRSSAVGASVAQRDMAAGDMRLKQLRVVIAPARPLFPLLRVSRAWKAVAEAWSGWRGVAEAVRAVTFAGPSDAADQTLALPPSWPPAFVDHAAISGAAGSSGGASSSEYRGAAGGGTGMRSSTADTISGAISELPAAADTAAAAPVPWRYLVACQVRAAKAAVLANRQRMLRQLQHIGACSGRGRGRGRGRGGGAFR